MRKGLLLSVLLTCLLIFTLPVSANSVFGDLPNNHWAFGALEQLVKDGVIAGDPDRFQPGKSISRYEAALLVANGYTKVNKVTPDQKYTLELLSKEFKSELEKIGAAPAKSLAEKADSKLNIMVETRLQLNSTSLGPNDAGGGIGTTDRIDKSTQFSERFRIYLDGPIGDKWKFNARYFQQKLNAEADDGNTGAGNTNGRFDRFWVTGKDILGGTVEMGKQGIFPGKGTFFGNLGDVDGIFYTYKKGKSQIQTGYARWDWALNGSAKSTPLHLIDWKYKFSPQSDIGAFLVNHEVSPGVKDIDMLAVNGAVELKNGNALSFEWAKNRAPGAAYNKSGYIIAYQSRYNNTWRTPPVYDGAVNPFKKNDHAWALSYRHMPSGMAGQVNRGANAIVPLSLSVSDTGKFAYINNINDVNVWRADYYYVPCQNVAWAVFAEHVKDIQGRWSHNSIQTLFLFFFK